MFQGIAKHPAIGVPCLVPKAGWSVFNIHVQALIAPGFGHVGVAAFDINARVVRVRTEGLVRLGKRARAASHLDYFFGVKWDRLQEIRVVKVMDRCLFHGRFLTVIPYYLPKELRLGPTFLLRLLWARWPSGHVFSNGESQGYRLTGERWRLPFVLKPFVHEVKATLLSNALYQQLLADSVD
jgi:hypothetical protein